MTEPETTDYVDVTVEMRVEANDCKEAIEQVEVVLGDSNDLAVDWPTVSKVELVKR